MPSLPTPHRTIMHLTRWFLVAAAAPVLAACGSPTEQTCTTIAIYGLSVSAQDSATGVALIDSVQVVARSGAYADTAGIRSSSAGLALERSGTYTVTVTHPRAAVWERSGVQVLSDACHVIPVQVTAKLQMVSQ